MDLILVTVATPSIPPEIMQIVRSIFTSVISTPAPVLPESPPRIAVFGRTASGGKGKKSSAVFSSGTEDSILVDPCRIRFQHSRIRPYFSGCGRSVVETLESIRSGKISPQDLPPIQVIVGSSDNNKEKDDGPWYFSLNNRRLWVLKKCREEGLLENNVIRVRVRHAKSEAELKRYTLENCALEAKFLREPKPTKNDASVTTSTSDEVGQL